MPYNVTIDDISPLITYTGHWTDFCDRPPNKAQESSLYFGETFHSSGTPGSTATIRFNGTAIYIYGSKRPNYGYYTVTVDNGTPERFDAYVESPNGVGTLAQQLLFSRTGLDDIFHEVIFSNAEENSGRTTIDLDYVTWTSGMDSNIVSTAVDDADPTWAYVGPWELRAGKDVFNGTTHLVSALGARASLTFEGIGIYLYGHLWKDHGKFNITIDDGTPIALTGFASAWFAQVPLYYADNLGPGYHTLTAINVEGGGVLSIDSARILQHRPSIAVPQPETDGTSPLTNPGVIAGIACGVAAVVILAAALGWYWFRMRRRGQYKPVNVWDPRNGVFTAPPSGYAPKSAGPGWMDGTPQSHRVPYTGHRREKAALRGQPAPNARLMETTHVQAPPVNPLRVMHGGYYS